MLSSSRLARKTTDEKGLSPEKVRETDTNILRWHFTPDSLIPACGSFSQSITSFYHIASLQYTVPDMSDKYKNSIRKPQGVSKTETSLFEWKTLVRLLSFIPV